MSSTPRQFEPSISLDAPTLEHDLFLASESSLPASSSSLSDAVMARPAEASRPVTDVSVSQRMLSAVSGSLLTSLLVTPLDVVRVRLQSQSHAAASPTSTSNASTLLQPSVFGNTRNLGVTACCREVFWVNNNSSICFVTQPQSLSQTTAALASPTQSVANIGPDCAVENTQRKVFNSTFDGLRKIARNEGFQSLWRGLSPTLVMAIPANVIYFTGYDYLRYNPMSPVARLVPDAYAALVAGSVARVAAATVISPIEMFRTRMQAARGINSGLFRETLTGLRDMVGTQGFGSLWRGLTLTLWRDVPFSGLYWWGYESTRNMLHSARLRSGRREQGGKEDHAALFIDSFLAGAISGAAASVVTTPFDVGKTRQQVLIHSNDHAVPSKASGQASSASRAARELLPEERTMPRFLYHIFRTEGIPGLFRGWAARCLKVAPACAIMISSYEIGKRMAVSQNEENSKGGL